MNRSLTKSRAGLLWALIFIMGPAAAHAGIAVSPLKQEISLKPGEEGKVSLLLTYVNRTPGETSQKVLVSRMDVVTLLDGSLEFKDPGSLKTSASKWISLEQSEVSLEPGQSKALECTIKVPPSAKPGEYYSVAMVTLAQKGVTDKGVGVQYRIASGIFVTVLGRTFPKEARITQCELLWPERPAAGPAQTQSAGAPATPAVPTVRLLLHNPGEARFEANGKITVYDDQSRWVLTAPFTSKRPMVFGGDTRLFTAAINKPLAPGNYNVRVEMDYGSAWAKARRQLQVDVTPEQAEALALLAKKQHEQSAALEASVATLAAAVPPGATRMLAVTLKDISEGTVTCRATATAHVEGRETWLRLPEEPFTITKGARKSLVVNVEVPATATPGPYPSTITVDASVDGGEPTQISIPVDIDVKAGR
jgi:hypothetical protein